MDIIFIISMAMTHNISPMKNNSFLLDSRIIEREQECNSNERVYKGMLRDMDINRIKKENEGRKISPIATVLPLKRRYHCSSPY